MRAATDGADSDRDASFMGPDCGTAQLVADSQGAIGYMIERALEQSGLPVDMCQGEWGLGQWEMNLDHGAPPFPVHSSATPGVMR